MPFPHPENTSKTRPQNTLKTRRKYPQKNILKNTKSASISGRYIFAYGESPVLAKVYKLGSVGAVNYTEDGIEADITLERKHLHLLSGIKTVKT